VENATEDREQSRFDAQVLTRQALDENRDSFTNIITHLRQRLEYLVMNNNPDDAEERSRLLDDIHASKQCLEVCKVASETSPQKTYRVGEVIADNDSDNVVVNSLADLFNVKKAVSTNRSALLMGTMTEAALKHVTTQRYNSRFGAFAQRPNVPKAGTNSASVVDTRREGKPSSPQTGSADQIWSSTSHAQPSSKEVRKRVT
jgi:hypothetical protein